MVPAAPCVFRMAIWNWPGMHATDGVAEAVAEEDVGVDAAAAVTAGVGVTGKGVGSVLVAEGDGEPHAARTPMAASTALGINTRRIATQGTRNSRFARGNARSARQE